MMNVATNSSARTFQSEAQALITLVNARTTEQLYVAEGTSQKTDVSFGAGGGGYGASGFGALAGGGYSDTAIGKVVAARQIDNAEARMRKTDMRF